MLLSISLNIQFFYASKCKQRKKDEIRKRAFETYLCRNPKREKFLLDEGSLEKPQKNIKKSKLFFFVETLFFFLIDLFCSIHISLLVHVICARKSFYCTGFLLPRNRNTERNNAKNKYGVETRLCRNPKHKKIFCDEKYTQ